MREVFVDYNSVYEEGVFEGAANFAVDFDKLKVDVFSLEVGYGEDGVDGYLGELVMCFRDTGKNQHHVS